LSFFGCTLGARAKLARPARRMTADLVRLQNRADFLRVAAGRRRAVRPAFIVQAAPQPTEDARGTSVRVGFTASRKTDPDTRAPRILSGLRRGLHNKGRPHGSAASGGNTEKIGAVLEPYKVGCHSSRRSRQFCAGP